MPLQQIAAESEITAAFASMSLYQANENRRLVAPYREAVQQPALREFLDNLEASIPGARVHLLTTPEACQAVHGDGYSTRGVKCVTCLGTYESCGYDGAILLPHDLTVIRSRRVNGRPGTLPPS